jgi:hypothetical protein
MEDNIHETHISSDFLNKKNFLKQLDIIKQASEIAQAKIDYTSAHDDNIMRAIDVVEEFLKKKHRLCYGGQAINAHLPAKYKFYDPEFSIPDFDIMTPSQTTDIQVLIKDLKKAGFTEISVREGMHEGTIKVYVDYIPVADMTAIDPKLYKILSKREFRLDGISYLDANTLRMLMYLELSRPRGEVGRWPKVFERLSLFNEFVPVKQCKISRDLFRGGLTEEETKFTLDFIIENKRIFAGADLLDFYDNALKHKKKDIEWIIGSKKPIIFLSADADNDSKKLREEFNFLLNKSIQKQGNNNKSAISIKSFSSSGIDLIPSMKVITHGNKSLVFIINQSACHSYFNVPLKDNKIIRIGSMDTLITLYFSLGLIDSKYYDMGSMECLANHLVKISNNARKHPENFGFPFISIKCTGHQTSLSSLIRAKVKRITQKKKELRKLLELENKPKNNVNKRRNTINKKRYVL